LLSLAAVAPRSNRGHLSQLGFEVLPSAANFVFARHPARSGAALAAALREQGVLVRHFDKPRIADYLRITVGASSDTNRLMAALIRCLGSGSSG
jgi:histidinol-phosphate aminotransferase